MLRDVLVDGQWVTMRVDVAAGLRLDTVADLRLRIVDLLVGRGFGDVDHLAVLGFTDAVAELAGPRDEAFELLTLVQTGKSDLYPIVLLDAVDGSYWRAFDRYIRGDLLSRRLIDPDDVPQTDCWVATDGAWRVGALRGAWRPTTSCRPSRHSAARRGSSNRWRWCRD